MLPLDVHLITLHLTVSCQVADPTYMLPALAGLSFLATVELGAADGMEGQVRPAAVLAPGAACIVPGTATGACTCREHHVYAVQLWSALSVAHYVLPQQPSSPLFPIKPAARGDPQEDEERDACGGAGGAAGVHLPSRLRLHVLDR